MAIIIVVAFCFFCTFIYLSFSDTVRKIKSGINFITLIHIILQLVSIDDDNDNINSGSEMSYIKNDVAKTKKIRQEKECNLFKIKNFFFN